MMRLLAALLALIAAPALAETYHIADSGTDAGNCGGAAPCATMQFAVDQAPAGGPHTVLLACNKPAGQECGFAPVNIAHFRFIGIIGDCSVAGFGRTKIVVPSYQIGVNVQDHATGTAQCVAFEGGYGAKGIALRQYAIGDCAFCWFRDFPGGIFIAADEHSKFNAISNIYFMGTAASAVSAGTFSEVSLNTTLVYGAVAFSDANLRVLDGKISLSGAVVVNGGPTGMQWSLTNGILEKGSVIIPGSVSGWSDAHSKFR